MSLTKSSDLLCTMSSLYVRPQLMRYTILTRDDTLKIIAIAGISLRRCHSALATGEIEMVDWFVR